MQELAIYFENGHVAYFKQVTNFKDHGTHITFNYFGQASQLHRFAQFDNYAGYSISSKKEDEADR